VRVLHAEQIGGPAIDALSGKAPTSTSGLALVDEPAQLWAGGKLMAVYTQLDGELMQHAEYVTRNSAYSESRRTAGLPQRSVVYGALPRLAVRNDFCRHTAASHKSPELYERALLVAQGIAAAYRAVMPAQYAAHEQAIDGVLPAWRMPDTPFTAINFNENFAIPFHRDSANTRDVASNVVIGGQLVLPEWGAALAMRHGSLVIFHGYSVMHGVTPIKRIRSDGYRCSIVAYSLGEMARCLSPAAELARAQERRDDVEATMRPDLRRYGIRLGPTPLGGGKVRG